MEYKCLSCPYRANYGRCPRVCYSPKAPVLRLRPEAIQFRINSERIKEIDRRLETYFTSILP